MKNLLGLAFLVLVAFQCISCDTIEIRGNLEELPDGMIFLIDQKKRILDSAATSNGEFQLEISKNKEGMDYTYVELEHKAKDGTKRLFNFKTNRLYRNGPWLSQFFILEDSIQITGTIEDFSPKDFKLSEKIKLVYPSDFLKSGRQTRVMYNVDYDFSQSPNDSLNGILKTLIQKYPYSYYLIHEISRHRNNYSASQLKELITLFDRKMLMSSEAEIIKKTIELRTNNFNSVLNASFRTIENTLSKVIDNNAKLSMVILWASWCGPCIREIPDLKEIYEKYKLDKRLNMVSVSVDENELDWRMALKKYNMPWKQLWVQKALKELEREIFKFDGNIPVVLFINNKGDVIKKIVGYEKDNIQKYQTIIDSIVN